jgi:hypothetical protein
VGDPVELAVVSGAGHAELVDPRSDAWQRVAAWLDAGPGA